MPVDKRLGAEWVPDGLDVILCAHAHLFVTPEARAKARLGLWATTPACYPAIGAGMLSCGPSTCATR